jgi:twitching motility protein PilU
VTAPSSVRELFAAMGGRRATDLYLKADTPPMFRVAGVVESAGPAPLPAAAVDGLVGELLNDTHREAIRRAGHADFAYYDPALGRFRVNVYVQRGTLALVARRVLRDIPSFEDLVLPSVVGDLALMPRGLVLVTGPAGSGKSTSLAAMIDHRNRSTTGHIITIEDPIEFLHADRRSIVSQREVGTDAESFAAALRGALRQTPDVLLIGEIRDVDSATAAVYFAETGHLVLSTLHTINVSQSLDRLLHFFPPEVHSETLLRLAATLVGVMGQRLVARSDGGLIPGVEILRATPYVRDLIRRGELGQLRQAMADGREDGMQTFDESFFELYQRGLVSVETALEFAESPNDLRLRLRGFAPARRMG